jgi:hypothetical protein
MELKFNHFYFVTNFYYLLFHFSLNNFRIHYIYFIIFHEGLILGKFAEKYFFYYDTTFIFLVFRLFSKFFVYFQIISCILKVSRLFLKLFRLFSTCLLFILTPILNSRFIIKVYFKDFFFCYLFIFIFILCISYFYRQSFKSDF